MEKERIRAKTMGYPSPIQPNKIATDHDYNEALKLILKNIQHMAVVIGTHNEDSVQLAATLLEDANLPLNHQRVHVAQLFGMSDHISFNASNAGLNTAKYLPFGARAGCFALFVSQSRRKYIRRRTNWARAEINSRRAYPQKCLVPILF